MTRIEATICFGCFALSCGGAHCVSGLLMNDGFAIRIITSGRAE
jgi:hypothetical protein